METAPLLDVVGVIDRVRSELADGDGLNPHQIRDDFLTLRQLGMQVRQRAGIASRQSSSSRPRISMPKASQSSGRPTLIRSKGRIETRTREPSMALRCLQLWPWRIVDTSLTAGLDTRLRFLVAGKSTTRL